MAKNATHRAWERYKTFVTERSDTVSQIESFVRCLSYVLPARLDSSNVVSELLYSASNLLVLLNDTILRNSIKISSEVEGKEKRLRLLLSVLDAAEVFLELSSEKVFGPSGRWVIVVCIQIVKAAIRILLLYRSQTGLQLIPSVPSLNRKVLQEVNKHKDQNGTEAKDVFNPLSKGDGTEDVVTLKRSGRQIRTLKSAPPLMYRTWKLPATENQQKQMVTEVNYIPTRLSPAQVKAELLHIVRPLVHLLGMCLFGQSSWKPWIVACGMDVSSLCMMGSPSKFSVPEQAELRRRTYQLILYILRSPFYDRVSKAKVLLMLHMISNNLPGLGWLARPLVDYLPVWQKIYSYVWAI